MKKSCPAYQGYPTCRGETTRPPELSRPPRRVRVHNVNGWLNFGKKQAKRRYLGQRNLGESCLGCPRPYKWGLHVSKHVCTAIVSNMTSSTSKRTTAISKKVAPVIRDA